MAFSSDFARSLTQLLPPSGSNFYIEFMPRFQFFLRFIPAVWLLALMGGCAQRVTPNSTASLGSPSAVAQVPVAQGAVEPFAEGIKYATSAANLAQTARSPAQWDEVSKQWLQAIYWMQSVPPTNPRRAFAQKKVAEYMRYLIYAQQQATVSSRLNYPTFNSDILDEQLGLYLSYIEAMGRPDILIVGSSRAVQGVDPRILRQALGSRGLSGLRVFNFGIHGATAQVVRFQLQELLGPEHLPRMILWADGVRAFNSGRFDRTYNEIVQSPGYQRLGSGVRPQLSSETPPQEAIASDSPGEYQVQPMSFHPFSDSRGVKDLSSKVLGQDSAGNRMPLCTDSLQCLTGSGDRTSSRIATGVRRLSALGLAIDAYGFLPVATRFNPSRYYRQRSRVEGRYDGDYANFQVGSIQGAALQSVAAFARSRQIPLVIVNLPVTDDYLDATRSAREVEFRQYMRRLSAQAFLWRDLSTVRGLNRNDYFEDPSHLNQFGAAAVARSLAADPNIPWPRGR
ncbi:hypothetical protein [Laspinema olomoucense]|nr:hypothetical protein [Laspinema sp. D3a]MCT7990591.1 hypothetical protein [Laspinema sp. D3a]